MSLVRVSVRVTVNFRRGRSWWDVNRSCQPAAAAISHREFSRRSVPGSWSERLALIFFWMRVSVSVCLFVLPSCWLLTILSILLQQTLALLNTWLHARRTKDVTATTQMRVLHHFISFFLAWTTPVRRVSAHAVNVVLRINRAQDTLNQMYTQQINNTRNIFIAGQDELVPIIPKTCSCQIQCYNAAGVAIVLTLKVVPSQAVRGCVFYWISGQACASVCGKLDASMV